MFVTNKETPTQCSECHKVKPLYLVYLREYSICHSFDSKSWICLDCWRTAEKRN